MLKLSNAFQMSNCMKFDGKLTSYRVRMINQSLPPVVLSFLFIIRSRDKGEVSLELLYGIWRININVKNFDILALEMYMVVFELLR